MNFYLYFCTRRLARKFHSKMLLIFFLIQDSGLFLSWAIRFENLFGKKFSHFVWPFRFWWSWIYRFCHRWEEIHEGVHHKRFIFKCTILIIFYLTEKFHPFFEKDEKSFFSLHFPCLLNILGIVHKWLRLVSCRNYLSNFLYHNIVYKTISRKGQPTLAESSAWNMLFSVHCYD